MTPERALRALVTLALLVYAFLVRHELAGVSGAVPVAIAAYWLPPRIEDRRRSDAGRSSRPREGQAGAYSTEQGAGA